MKDLTTDNARVLESLNSKDIQEKDFDAYFLKFGRLGSFPKGVQELATDLFTAGIKSPDELEDLLSGSVDFGKNTKNLIVKYNVLKNKGVTGYLPQVLGTETVNNLIDGKSVLDAEALDFKSQKSIEYLFKYYSPVFTKFSGIWGKKCQDAGMSLTSDDFLSTAWATFAWATKAYCNDTNKVMSLSDVLGTTVKDRPDEDLQDNFETSDKELTKVKKNHSSFRTFLMTSLQFAALLEINANSRNVRVPSSAFNAAKASDMNKFGREVSLDTAFGDDEEPQKTDHYRFLGADDRASDAKDTSMGNLIQKLRKMLAPRDFKWFCETYALNGMEKKSATDIAAEENISQSFVSRSIRNTITKIKTDPELKQYLEDLRNAYLESLGASVFLTGNIKFIKESLTSDFGLSMLINTASFDRVCNLLDENFEDAEKKSICECIRSGSYIGKKELLNKFFTLNDPTIQAIDYADNFAFEQKLAEYKEAMNE